MEKRKIIGKIAERTRPYASLLFLLLAALLFFSVLRASLFSEVEEDKRIWFEVSFLLFAAILAEFLVVYLKQPTVMTLLIVGILISPSAISLAYPLLAGGLNAVAGVAGFAAFPASVPHLVSSEGFVRVFAQIGAIILLFEIGLHSRVSQIFNLRNFIVGLLGVILPFVGGYYYAVASGHGFGYAMFLGAALTATSVGVTVAVLRELGVLEKEFAKIILGAAVIDDVLALLALSLVTNFPAELTAPALAPFAQVLAAAAVFLVGGVLLGKFIVTKYFDAALAGTPSRREYLAILAYVFAYAYVSEFIGLSAIVGAFIAGITLNYSKNSPKIVELFFPLGAFFTPIFFISLGMLVDLTALAANIVPILVITLIAVAAKVVGCGAGAAMMGVKLRESIAVGIGMVPRGEIALIIGLYGLTAVGPDGNSILGPNEYAVIASMAFLTTIIIPVLLKKIVETQEGNAQPAGQ
ncbi:MAG: cation:proton antiporter [Candidatus Micrarchaeota archaeon]